MSILSSCQIKFHADMELPCAPPLKLNHPYEDSISLEMNDGQNQIIIYRSPLSQLRKCYSSVEFHARASCKTSVSTRGRAVRVEQFARGIPDRAKPPTEC
jgi:hypothetical protein